MIEQGEVVLGAHRDRPRHHVQGVALARQHQRAAAELLDGVGAELGVGIADGGLKLQAMGDLPLTLEVEALADGVAEVGGVLDAAGGHIDGLLDVLPFDVIGAGADRDGPIQETVLGADLVVQGGVGAVRGGEGPAARGRGQGRGGAADPIPFRYGAIDHVVGGELVGQVHLGGEGGFVLTAGDDRRRAAVVEQVLRPGVQVVIVEVGPGVTDADVEFQLVEDRIGPVEEQGDLAVVAGGVVEVVVAIGQQVLAPGGEHILTP